MRRLLRTTAAFAIGAALTACAATPSPDAAYLGAFRAAEAAGRPFPPITDTAPDATMADAYRLQRGLVSRAVARGERVAGYKGGLMSQASMQGRKVTEPLVGVLFTSGRVEGGGVVSLCGYRKASFEAKIGFVFDRPVRTLPADVAALKAAVASVQPAIDLPDIAYRNPDSYGAVDMVAANISAARYVRGAAQAPAAIDLDALKVTVSRDGQQLTSGLGRESLGDQWASLLTVVRLILDSGRTIAPGDLVITGKIGDRAWLPPGAYTADYGALGMVPFTVEACKG